MKEDRFEKFVRDNREDFDIHSPSPELWEQLNKQLKKSVSKHWTKSPWLKVAAVFVLAILGSGVLLNNYFSPSHQLHLAAKADPELQELIEAESYYAHEVDGRLKEIQKCYKLNPELKSEVEGDLEELDTMYNSLKNDLKDNVSNKEVIEAMIENNRYRLKLVDDVLSQINC
ncbi:MAG TPA: hypothetical protein VKA27_02275 [Sunxiuqinia sp.]|nr:hypothetical protein [Sunxiuqinia sp.]